MKKIVTEAKLANIFRVFSVVLFAVFLFFSFVSTWINSYDLDTEHVFVQKDSLLQNALGLGIIILGCCLLYRLAGKWNPKLNMDIVALVVCVLAGAFSVYWVSASGSVPQADQQLICMSAEEFENGNYERLNRGQYAGIFRHQLGQITFMRLLFKLFGNGNFQAFQYLNALMVPVLIFSGYKIVKQLSSHSKWAEGIYLLLMATCVPLYCYVPFVYGEIISTTLVIFAAWMLLWSFERFSVVKTVLLSVALGAAVQFRKNTLIFIIAFLLVALIRLLRGNVRQTLINIAGIILGVVLFQTYITNMYRELIPENSPAVPSIVYVAMGVNSDNGMAGWHNYYDQLAFGENDYDVEKTNQAAKAYILAFLETCKENPVYGVDFYYRKLSSQWNVPMYQCLAMNNKIEGEQSALAAELYFGKLREVVQAEMNLYQLVVYGGVLCLLLLSCKKWREIDNYLLLIAVFGGFLFSVMWEAKPRYIFPYFLVMLPYAAMGAGEFIKLLCGKFQDVVRKNKV